MRIALFGVLMVLGCGDDRSDVRVDAPQPPVDARTVDATDANDVFCPAGTGTANVTAGSGGNTTTYTQLHAGGIWFTGPVAPPSVAGPDMSATLLFMNLSQPLLRETGWCCEGADQACCTLDGIRVQIDVLPAGAEVGTHAARIYNFHDTAFVFAATVTITSFSQPYENPPGRIAGSIAGTSGTKSVSGSFDNTFCAALLSQTI